MPPRGHLGLPAHSGPKSECLQYTRLPVGWIGAEHCFDFGNALTVFPFWPSQVHYLVLPTGSASSNKHWCPGTMTGAPVVLQAKSGQAELHPTLAVTLHPAWTLERPRPSLGPQSLAGFWEHTLSQGKEALEVCPLHFLISWLSCVIPEERRSHVAELLPNQWT